MKPHHPVAWHIFPFKTQVGVCRDRTLLCVGREQCCFRQGNLQITPRLCITVRLPADQSHTQPKAQGISKCRIVLCSCLSSMACQRDDIWTEDGQMRPVGPNFTVINLLQHLPSSSNLKSSFFSMDGCHTQHQNGGHASALPLIVLSPYRNTNIKFSGIANFSFTMTRFISSSLLIISQSLPMHSDIQDKLFFDYLGFLLLLYFSSAIGILLCG